MSKIKQEGKCNTCEIETGDKWYVFCSIECRDIWIELKEKHMGDYDVDKDLYIKWFEERTLAIEKMTREELEARIKSIVHIQFFARREMQMATQQFDKITGRKGIPPWVKHEIGPIDPEVKVNWDGEPRPKPKKQTKLEQDLGFLGITNINDAMREVRAKNKANNKEEKKEEKPKSQSEIIEELANALANPAPQPVKLSSDELKAKADAMRERARLAKEGKQNG